MLIAVSVFEIAADDPGGSFGWGPAVAAAVPFGRDFVAVGVATFPLLLQVGRQAGIAYLGIKHRRRTALVG